jgi:hypothetical protein
MVRGYKQFLCRKDENLWGMKNLKILNKFNKLTNFVLLHFILFSLS